MFCKNQNSKFNLAIRVLTIFINLVVCLLPACSSSSRQPQAESVPEPKSVWSDNKDPRPVDRQQNQPVQKPTARSQSEKQTERSQPGLPKRTSPPIISNGPIDQKLVPGDTIRVDVAGEEMLSRELTVPADGIVFFPMIKRLQLRDKSSKELTQELTTRLKDYLRDPVINVFIVKRAERKVYLYISEQGFKSIVLSPNKLSTISTALMDAELPDDADLSTISIVRRNQQGEKKVFKVSLIEILEQNASQQDLVIQPNDVLVVKKKPKIYIQGSVSNPGAFPLTRYEQKSLWEALSLAGGPKSDADLTRVQIISETGDGEKEIFTVSASLPTQNSLNIKETVFVKPGDIIVVPSQSQNFVTIYGQVKQPGTVPISSDKETRLSTIIAKAGGLTEYASHSIAIFRYLSNKKLQKFYVKYGEMTDGDPKHDIIMKAGDIVYIYSSIL